MTRSGGTSPAARVPDDDAIYRRLSHGGSDFLYQDPLTRERRPSTGAFRIKRDEDGLSVYREQLMRDLGLTIADIVVAPSNKFVRLAVADVRAVPPLDVRDDLWPSDVADPAHPRNGAHALIDGWNGLTKSQRRECQRKLVSAPSLAVYDSSGKLV